MRVKQTAPAHAPENKEPTGSSPRPKCSAPVDGFSHAKRASKVTTSPPGTSEVNGVTIVSHGCSAEALAEAERVTRLLTHRADISKRVDKSNVTLVIIPASKKMTDLPEFASLRGKKTFDGRPWEDVRGSGGLASNGRIVIGVAEENLAELGSNTYPKGYSVAMHELAHALQNHALPKSDKKRIDEAYDAREAAGGPWTESYGASNESEYFAQLTNAWFDTNDGVGHNGPDWVRTNDPTMALVLEQIYGPLPAS